METLGPFKEAYMDTLPGIKFRPTVAPGLQRSTNMQKDSVAESINTMF